MQWACRNGTGSEWRKKVEDGSWDTIETRLTWNARGYIPLIRSIQIKICLMSFGRDILEPEKRRRHQKHLKRLDTIEYVYVCRVAAAYRRWWWFSFCTFWPFFCYFYWFLRLLGFRIVSTTSLFLLTSELRQFLSYAATHGPTKQINNSNSNKKSPLKKNEPTKKPAATANSRTKSLGTFAYYIYSN